MQKEDFYFMNKDLKDSWTNHIDYLVAPKNLKRALLKKGYTEADAEQARIDLEFDINSCKSEKHMLKMLKGTCKKYGIAISIYSYNSHYKYNEFYRDLNRYC